MLPVLPSTSDLQELTSHRDDASVTIYLPASPQPRETDRTRMLLKSTVADAAARLAATGVATDRVRQVVESLESLDENPDFWVRQARGLALFAAPGVLRTFRMVNSVQPALSISDRFDVGVLLRSVSFPHAAFVLSVTEGGAHLYAISATEPTRELELEGLPEDLHTVLEYTTTEDDHAVPRAQGANGEKTEQQRYCRIIQKSALARVNGSNLPLILAASRELEPAYRAVNTYSRLADESIRTNPDALTVAEITERARAILDRLYQSQLAAWAEKYEVQRSRDRATGDLGHVARAATAGAVEELVFDMDADVGGWIDQHGALRVDDEDPDANYGVLDEIAARVLKSSGTVYAVRADDVPNGSPVAAILRYPF